MRVWSHVFLTPVLVYWVRVNWNCSLYYTFIVLQKYIPLRSKYNKRYNIQVSLHSQKKWQGWLYNNGTHGTYFSSSNGVIQSLALSFIMGPAIEIIERASHSRGLRSNMVRLYFFYELGSNVKSIKLAEVEVKLFPLFT